MPPIALSELKKIPFLDIENIDGRFISTITFYVENEWHTWVPSGESLMKIKGWPAESFYFCDVAENESDIYFHFFDFLEQRAALPKVQKPLFGLRSDFFNLSASLAKIDWLFKSKDNIYIKQGISRLVSTEIEYIFSLCRSVFDLLQEIIVALWNTIELHDTSMAKKKLKDSFSGMVLHEEKAVTAEILTNKFGLPQPLTDFYVRNADFFMTLRSFRDNIVHRGSSIPVIFSTEKGFAVQENLAPFSKFNVWTEEHKQANGLCSLRPAIGHVIHQTICVCEDFSQTIEKIILFPPPIAPGLKLFMRGYFNIHLISNIDAISNCLWWDADNHPKADSNTLIF